MTLQLAAHTGSRKTSSATAHPPVLHMQASSSMPGVPWQQALMKEQPKCSLDTLLQLLAYLWRHRDRCCIFSDSSGDMAVVASYGSLICSVMSVLKGTADEVKAWVAAQRERCQQDLESLKNGTECFACPEEVEELIRLLHLRFRPLFSMPSGRLLRVLPDRLEFDPDTPLRDNPDTSIEALQPWLRKVAADLLGKNIQAGPEVFECDCSDLDEASDRLNDAKYRQSLSFLVIPSRPPQRKGREGQMPASDSANSTVQPQDMQETDSALMRDHAKLEEECERLKQELAAAKSQVQALQDEIAVTKKQCQQLTEASGISLGADLRTLLIESATYKERSEQMSKQLDKAEAELARRASENQRLLVENATLKERCKMLTVPRPAEGGRGDESSHVRGISPVLHPQRVPRGPAGIEVFASQDSGLAERMGYTLIEDDGASASSVSVLSQSSWFCVKPNCFVLDTIFRTRSCGIDFFLMGKDLTKGSRVVAADDETILEVTTAPEVCKATDGFDLHAGGATLRVTADHMVLVPDPHGVSDKGLYVKAGDLKEGDLVLVDSWEPVPLTRKVPWSAEFEVLKIIFQPDLPVAVFSCPPCILSKGHKKKTTRRGGMRHAKGSGATEDQTADGHCSIPNTRGDYMD